MKASIKQQRSHSLKIAIALGLAVVMTSCGKKDEAPAATAATATAPAATPATAEQAPAIPPASAIPTSWTAEAMEELLAPIALYPDPILTQVLVASGNPQEVLDAGNWLLQNESLKGTALEQAATKVGFTPPTVALLQFPATLDMMCQEMGWTTELGQAFATDQEGVLAAVQRLRAQAVDVGNLKTSPQMTVSMETSEGDGGASEQVIYLKPTDPEVIYVPQYDPQTVYAPAPVATTTVVQEGHSDGAMVTTALLAFGAGMLVNEIFDDDDYDNYYPRYGYGGGYYGYNHYPYRPVYGNGYYPNHGYNRPPGYNSGWNNNGWQNNNNGWQNNGNINTGDININTGGNRYGGSPISKNNPNRDMSKINQRSNGANGNRQGTNAGKADWKGQSGYAGAKGASKGKPSADMANKGRDQARTSQAGGKQLPKQQGGYAGAKPGGNNTRDMQKPNAGNMNKPSAGNMQKPNAGNMNKSNAGNMQKSTQKQGDRGRNQDSSSKATRQPQQQQRQPQQQNRQASQQHSGGGGNRNSAVSGSRGGGGNAKASSQRGQQSRSGGGGGGNRSKRN